MRTQGTIVITICPVPNSENVFTVTVVAHGHAKKPFKVQFDLIIIILTGLRSLTLLPRRRLGVLRWHTHLYGRVSICEDTAGSLDTTLRQFENFALVAVPLCLSMLMINNLTTN